MAFPKQLVTTPIKFLLLVLYTIASYVVPKDRRLLLFGGSHEGNSRAVYLHCKEYLTDYRLAWIAHERFAHEQDTLGADFVRQWSLASIWLVLRARFLFINHQASEISLFPLIGRFPMVQLWHGTPMKMILFDMKQWREGKGWFEKAISLLEYRNYRVIVASSELGARCMASAFRVRNESKIRMVGLPRNDRMLKAESRRLKGHEAFGRVLLYAPTYRESGDLPPFVLESGQRRKLIAALEERNDLLLLKPHRIDRGAFAGIDFESKHVVNMSNSEFDVVDLFVHVDVLVTDYSSIVFDYCLLGKPVVFFAYDLERYVSTSRELYFDYMGVIPGPVARDLDELLEVLQRIESIAADPVYREAYGRFLGLFHEHRDARATERLLETLGLTGDSRR